MEAANKKKTKRNHQGGAAWWAALIVLVVIGGFAGYILGGGSLTIQSAQANSGTDYMTNTVKRGDLQISVAGSGNLVANRSVDLNFSTGGKVVELNVKLGDQVSAGSVLARLGNADNLEAAIASYQLQLLQAEKELRDMQIKADVALAEAYQSLVKAQAKYDQAVFAHNRMAYARCSKEVNARYAGQVEQAKNRLDELTRQAYGSDAWIAARSAYDTALANYNYCAAYTDAEKTEALAAMQLAESQVKAAEQTYTTLKAGASGKAGIAADAYLLAEAKIKEAQLQLTKANHDLNGITLTAPFDGKVTYLAASAGAIVNTGKFMTISDLSRPTLEVYVDENEMGELVVGYKAEVEFDALPQQVFIGKVVMVEPELVSEGQSRLVKGRVELDESSAAKLDLVPLGANASVEIISKESDGVLIVPAEAVRDLGGQLYGVFVVNASGQLTLKSVEVGLQDSTQAEIKSGLNEGDRVSTGTVPTTK